MAETLRQLRYNRTRASNRVKSSIHHLLTEPARWNLRGDPVGPDYLGLPSWWNFWADVLVSNVRDAVKAGRELAKAEGKEL